MRGNTKMREKEIRHEWKRENRNETEQERGEEMRERQRITTVIRGNEVKNGKTIENGCKNEEAPSTNEGDGGEGKC